MSQCVALFTSGFSAEKNARVSAPVLNIFQFPAITGLRMGYRFSVRASTPGNLSPARNSSEAPPPVEMWLILSETPD